MYFFWLPLRGGGWDTFLYFVYGDKPPKTVKIFTKKSLDMGPLFIYQLHAKKLNRFYLNYLRKLFKINWQDKIPDVEVRAHGDMMSLHTLLMKYQLKWTGHVIRMQDTHLPKKLLFGELKSGENPYDTRANRKTLGGSPGRALTLESNTGMCRGHDPLFSGQLTLLSQPIYHQCAAHVRPPFSIKLEKNLHFQALFSPKISNFPNFLFPGPLIFEGKSTP